jgi:hypothetical protein
MESAVRSPRIKSAITTGRARNDALLASQDSQNSRQPTGIGRQNPAAGNGIFGCRDWRLKIGLKDRKGHRRPKEWNDTGENPPQIRPIGSRRRDLRFRRTGWWCAQSDTNRSPVGNSLLTGKLTGNFAILVPRKRISLHETAVPQRLLVKFPTQINRENISGNREFLAGNRECSRKIRFGARSPGSP